MKNLTFLLLFIGGMLFKANAQAPGYDDLIQYYASEEYEKCLKKAYKYTQGDKTRKDAIPYLYLSKASFEIHKKGGPLLEKYPRVKKDALKYAGKCIQKDKEGTVYTDNMAYFTELKADLVEEIRNYVDDKNWGKLMNPITSVLKIDKSDVGVYFLKTAIYAYKKDFTGMKKIRIAANEAFANAKEDAYTISEDDSYDITEKKKVDILMLKIGVIEYAYSMVAARKKDAAVDILGKTKQWYPETPENSDYTDCYNSIIN